MQAALVVTSGVLSVASVLPYITDVIKRQTKPRIVSWSIWCLLSAITTAAAFTDHQYPTAIMTGIGVLETLLIVILGWRFGDRRFARLDTVCLFGALVGLGLWYQFNSPALAVIAMVVIDMVGSVPTLVHAWRWPYEETWLTFVLWSISSLFTILAIRQWQVTSYLPPVYYIVMNTVIALVILVRQKYSARGKALAVV